LLLSVLGCQSGPLHPTRIQSSEDQKPTPREASVKPGINYRYKKVINVQDWIDNFEIESREIYHKRAEILAEIGIKSGILIASRGRN